MDTGLNFLVAIARFHQLPAEPDQLAHVFFRSEPEFSDTELLLATKRLTLKIKELKVSLVDLKNRYCRLLPRLMTAVISSLFVPLPQKTAPNHYTTKAFYLRVLEKTDCRKAL